MRRAACAWRARFPAVIYGAKEPSVAVELDPKQMLRILHSESGHNTIFDVEVQGSARVKAMIVDWQYEPIKGTLLHVDLKRIAMDASMVRRGADPPGRHTGRGQDRGRHARPGAA